MKSPFSLFLALRYVKPKRTFVSVISLISVIGVMLGITVLILVISVMTGFEKELRQKVLGFDPHILVGSTEGVLGDWQEVMKTVAATPNVVAVSPFVQGPVIAQYNNQRLAPNIRGIDVEREKKVTGIDNFIIDGELDLSGDSAVIGVDLARRLGVKVGSVITVYSPGNIGKMLETLEKAEKDPKEIDRAREFFLPAELTVTGIFKSDRYFYDSEFILVPLHIGQELYGLDVEDQTHGLSVRTNNPDAPAPIRNEILDRSGDGITAQTWEEMNRTFFEAIAMERNVMFFILMFIIIVAAFGIMNTLITVTIQKTREIGIMKALGATTSQIIWVFLGQGIIVGVVGNIAGVALGMTLITYRNEVKDWLADKLGVEVFPAAVYQFSKIPALVIPKDVAIICASAFVICALAALLPAFFAARLDPVKALRQK